MKYKEISLREIESRPDQVRQNFSEARIDSLAKSIAEVGQLQPIIVQKKDNHYLLIAGERRLRAVKKEEREKIAAVILEAEVSPEKFRQIQLIENLQRQDLNPLERATSINKFMEANNLSKKDAAEKLGVARTTLTLWLNILEMKEKYQKEVLKEDSPITLSHLSLAHALSSKTGDPNKANQLLDAVIKHNLSRKETQEVLDLFYKYLHIPMEEAVAAVLLKRERMKMKEYWDVDSDKNSHNPVRKLFRSFSNINDNLEEFMEVEGNLPEEDREELLNEFLYLYQIMGILIPDLKDKSLASLVTDIKAQTK
ncbi:MULTISPECIES: ParB/RepB/Spo0J family partition protein [Halanaerobium]|jgi:ParB family chromosome partitioning protein|uniref:ParB family chromosome partitioning protein n=1 Tax=Halanaerobium saccharolyticum TaxID=43595 RepID=A0A4R6R1B7_9FIRM|nr:MULTISPECIES: ParB/RepB/Spo0J family partition protein [Halanaerobium]PUU87127.1 MAG: parB-like partition protein [Halanaerobium sp.]RCW56563.1 ParB family chromosome partitioning protein [Halanaerobium sp. ST460_2HS_T2]TDP79511.1 ParB family chromosome partitioning protein [Halanaerobium saccharolyticum]